MVIVDAIGKVFRMNRVGISPKRCWRKMRESPA